MKLTPLDVRHKEFRRALRGYSEEDVDVFLDEVADEFERLFQENIDLRDRVERLEGQVAQYEDLKETLQKTLVSAQQQADEMRANARKEGELVLRDAELKGRGIVSDSYSEKQRVQQSLIQLRQIEEDFRFKFRSLLEAHLNLLAEDEVSEERRQFRGLVAGVEQELQPPTSATLSAPGEVGRRVDVASEPVFVGSEAAMEPVELVDEVPSLRSDPEPAHERESGIRADADAAPDWPGGEEEPDLQGYAPRLPEPDEEAVVIGDDGADEERKGSSVRRFLFGKREKEPSELPEEEDRDFQW